MRYNYYLLVVFMMIKSLYGATIFTRDGFSVPREVVLGLLPVLIGNAN